MTAATEPVRPTLVLASSSPRRRELIQYLGLRTVIVPSGADESVPADWTPDCVVRELAYRKAKSVYDSQMSSGDMEPNAIVVGSDTIVVLGRDILGKPDDAADARKMLLRLAGRTHEVYTGVCCIGAPDEKTIVDHKMTKVTFRQLTPEQIDRYVQTGDPLDKAGAYGIQGIGALLVDSIEGCYFNVVGLPISLLADMLKGYGVQAP